MRHPASIRSKIGVVQAFNRYRGKTNGEEFVVDQIASTLSSMGVKNTCLKADSADIGENRFSRLIAGMSAPFNVRSYFSASRAFRDLEGVSVLHAHNVFPSLSPSVLLAARRSGLATILTLHSYSLTCAVGSHWSSGTECTMCCAGKHWNGLLNNCRKSLIESAAYSYRNASVDWLGLVRRNVDIVHALSNFAAMHMIREGFPSEAIHVMPNAVRIPDEQANPSGGRYIAYAGRIVAEKGVVDLLHAAERTKLPVWIAGDSSGLSGLWKNRLPESVRLLGVLRGRELTGFYLNARFLAFPSRWYEMCPIVVLEAMAAGLPVVCYDVGGMKEIVIDELTGTVVRNKTAEGFSEALVTTWAASRSEIAELGSRARARAASEYNQEHYAARLLALYERAIMKRACPTASGGLAGID